MPDETMNIYQRLNNVMAEVSAVNKEGTAPAAAGGYRYVKHDDVMRVLRPALVKHGVVAIPTVAEHEHEIIDAGTDSRGNPRKAIYTRVKVRIAFVGSAGPDSGVVEIDGWGYGIDYQDKSIGKAVSYAVKMMLLKLFCLETGEDVERDSINIGTDQANDGVRQVPQAPPQEPSGPQPAKPPTPSAAKKRVRDALVAWKVARGNFELVVNTAKRQLGIAVDSEINDVLAATIIAKIAEWRKVWPDVQDAMAAGFTVNGAAGGDGTSENLGFPA